MIGERHGRLLVLRYVAGRKTRLMCRCSCGEERTFDAYRVRNGQTKSCGCLRAELNAERHVRHGESDRTPEYIAWKNMKARCLNPKNDRYYRYGARGIKVCARWLDSFENFLEDMGRKPSPKMSIGRKDNDGNYEPGNCGWETYLEQAQNRTYRRKNEPDLTEVAR